MSKEGIEHYYDAVNESIYRLYDELVEYVSKRKEVELNGLTIESYSCISAECVHVIQVHQRLMLQVVMEDSCYVIARNDYMSIMVLAEYLLGE